MPKKNSLPEAPEALTAKVRRLSSIEERLSILEDQKKAVRESIQSDMDSMNLKGAQTIYGSVVVRETTVFNYSEFSEVQEAKTRLAEAKAALKAAEEAAQAKILSEGIKQPEPTKVLAFTRNKAVSARAKKNRIYVATVLRRKVAR